MLVWSGKRFAMSKKSQNTELKKEIHYLKGILKDCQPIIDKYANGFHGHALMAEIDKILGQDAADTCDMTEGGHFRK